MKRVDKLFDKWGDYYDLKEPRLPTDFPEIVTLCGSTRFRDAFEAEMARLTNEGKIVLTVGRFGHLDGLDMDGELKKRLDELHLRKIDLSDQVHVINAKTPVCSGCGRPVVYDPKWGGYRCDPCGSRETTNRVVAYVGESTRNEIAYAKSKGKKITYLNEPS